MRRNKPSTRGSSRTSCNSVITALAILVLWNCSSFAADNAIAEWLKRPILTSNSPLAEVQAYTESRVLKMPDVKTAAEWQRYADQMRRDTLEKVVFRGEAAQWRKGRTKVAWLETIEGGPGYHIRKLRYEAVPGLWIPALLYEPDKLSGKVPVALNVNGHDALGKAAGYKQIRSINQAKRGMVVLNPEWLGMGQLRGEYYAHYTMNQIDLCGSSGLAPFYLAMQRGLDVLLAHENADPERVAVAGLSGGGWQTITISALDTRVKLSNPVAGYSSFRTRARFVEDLGDSEQTPSDLGAVTDYAHFTAMLAPRPALLTFNAKDDCCFASGHAMQPLLDAAEPIYKLFGKENFLRTHINYVPGTHNFGQDNREALYRMMGEFFLGDANFMPMEVPCENELKTNTVLNVELPTNNATFNSLALGLMKGLPRQKRLPSSISGIEKWQKENRVTLGKLVRYTNYFGVTSKIVATEVLGNVKVKFRTFKVGEWTVPGVEFGNDAMRDVTILVGDSGRQALAECVQKLLDKGTRALAVDPFYFGESKVSSHDFLYAMLVAGVGERPLGQQASQVGAIARWAENEYGQLVHLMAVGPRSSTIALVATALEPDAVSSLAVSDPLGSLKEVIEQNWGVNQKPELFCFGLLERFDIKHIAAMVAPRPLAVVSPSERGRKELSDVGPLFKAMKSEFHFESEAN